jgi:hypothetical protein
VGGAAGQEEENLLDDRLERDGIGLVVERRRHNQQAIGVRQEQKLEDESSGPVHFSFI